MFVALGFLLGLLGLCAIMPLVDGAVLPTLLPLIVASGLFLVARRLPSLEAERFGAVAKPLVVVLAVPAVLMLLQMTPLPTSLAHPVWASVRSGFPNSSIGSITVDIGATAIAFVRYLSFVGAMLLAMALSFDRDRAEGILIALTATTAFISLSLLVAESFGFARLAAHDEILDCACLGMILAAASACFVYERHETRRAKLGFGDARFIYPFLASLAAFLISTAAIAFSRSGSVIFAASCGLGLFCGVFLVRRLSLGRWGAGAIGLTAAVIVVGLVSSAAGTRSDPRLAFVKKDPATIELTQRILADSPFFGDGAGAFSSIMPIYQFGDGSAQERKALTAAAKLSIEMGRALLWAAVIAAGLAVVVLLRASAKRGRDSFFASAAASSIVSLLVLTFVNTDVFGTTLPTIAAVILGLGFAQSRSRAAAI